ncbi:MAG TPA: GIY-YIG nuclease family protein [Candidatus Polarisedimenticolia bacterium]|nr:GIY-YIG nuclease family protein [Candidatus Polarisedimenticolia bacterium]
MPWFVYLVRCRDGTLYTGVTNDPEARLLAHNAGRGARYTRGRGPVTLVHLEKVRGRRAALRREIAIKGLSRLEKIALVAAPASRPGGPDAAAPAPAARRRATR